MLMRNVAQWRVAASVFAALSIASSAYAKDYKSGELETTRLYGFGAFEARIRSAKGPGVISTFFLWRPGAETAPAVPWQEIDFEMGQASGDFQTQIMTPGSSPPLYRTEHAQAHQLRTRPWDAYYTYRMEWTPDYIAFFIDGREVRRETDRNTYGTLFAQDSTGDTPQNARMELRTGVWPGASNITGWSGPFDGSTVPTAHFVDYVKVWDYTPNQSNKFATVLLDEKFDTLNRNDFYPAQWTFEFSASDYVSQNIGTRDGRLVVALTTNAGQGILPAPPADAASPTIPTGPSFRIEAEAYEDFNDSTPANSGFPDCSLTDVDAELTSDVGGGCNIGWTTAGEWLEYPLTIEKDAEYEILARLASESASSYLHIEIDGYDVSGPLMGPGRGYQAFSDAAVPGVFLTAGEHTVRVFFDTGNLNFNYLTFTRYEGQAPTCLQSCDDGNACTTDSCDPSLGCVFQNNTSTCADDGNSCTNDLCSAGACTHPTRTGSCTDDGNSCTSDLCSAGVCTHPTQTGSCADDGNSCTSDLCSAGVCTHPTNGSCTSGDAPCTGLCNSPVRFTSASFSSGNLGSAATCYQTTANLNGGVCGNFSASRKLTLNGAALSCSGGNWKTPLPAKRNGGYCIQTTAGDFPWAYFVTW